MRCPILFGNSEVDRSLVEFWTLQMIKAEQTCIKGAIVLGGNYAHTQLQKAGRPRSGVPSVS